MQIVPMARPIVGQLNSLFRRSISCTAHQLASADQQQPSSAAAGLSRHRMSRTATAAQTESTASTPSTATSAAAAEGVDAENNVPTPFFGSRASMLTARKIQSGNKDDHIWYQPIVISASLAVFLFYFCVLREENDIDGKLDGNLFDHVAGLEETQLKVAYDYNKQNGKSTVALERRMAELAAAKLSAAPLAE